MNVSSTYPVQTVCVMRYRNSGCVTGFGNDIHVQDTTRQSLPVNVVLDERTSQYNCRVLAWDNVDQLSYIKYNIDIRTFIS